MSLIGECVVVSQLTSARVKTGSHNPVCIALKAVPRNASHATLVSLSTMTKPSAFVRGRRWHT